MSLLSEIKQLLASIPEQGKNRTGDIYINALKNEFITLQDRIEVPRISVQGVTPSQALFMVRQLYALIPEFLYNHVFLPRPKPHTDIFSLHFVAPIKGSHTDFIHLLKIDLKFGGDPSTITSQGNTEFYPGFTTNRIYYKSQLIPVSAVKKEHHAIIDFEPSKVIVTENVEADVGFYASVLFDDLPISEIVGTILQVFEEDIFPFSPKLYSFIDYHLQTACFKVVYPSCHEIVKATPIFELLLAIIAAHFKSDLVYNYDDAFFEATCTVKESSIALNEASLARLREYFSSYALYSDDTLALKRWRRIDVQH